MAADRDLLFGLLALRNGLIDQGRVVAAFRTWTRDKGRGLVDHLVGRGDLDADDRSAVESMVDRHLRKHGGDAEKSLATIATGRSTRAGLESLGNPDLTATIAFVRSESTDPDAESTTTFPAEPFAR